ncbi:hypothetical protein GGG16DRAFT_128002 [Schizophyllum commune]
MSFLRKKNPNKPLIPPVEEPARRTSPAPGGKSGGASPQPAYRPSNARTYVASRDGDPYGSSYGDRSNSVGSGRPGGTTLNDQASSAMSYRDKYARNASVGDAYSRGGGVAGDADRDRAELFSGLNPAKTGSGRFFDGPQIREPNPGEENDEDVEGIKQQTRFVKQESVNSTRNALRMAREAEETARNTLGRLGDQSEKLANTERHLDVSKGHSQTAADRTDELKQLNRSIFRPVITFNKDAKRAAKQAEIQRRYEDERSERERGMMDIRETQNRLGRAATYGRGYEDEDDITSGGVGGGSGRYKTEAQLAARKEQRKRYQFEATASDDEMEDELDDNLDEISEMTKRLKALGSAMGQELDTQNSRIDRIEGKTVNLDQKIFTNTERLKRIK